MWSAATIAKDWKVFKEKFEPIGDVRGMGLLQAMEFVKDRVSKEPDAAMTNKFMEECRNRGLLVGKGGLNGNVVRTSPPLNISKADVDEAIKIMDQALTAIAPVMAGQPQGLRSRSNQLAGPPLCGPQCQTFSHRSELAATNQLFRAKALRKYVSHSGNKRRSSGEEHTIDFRRPQFRKTQTTLPP